MPNLQKAPCFPFWIILLLSRIMLLLLLNHSALNGMVMGFFYTSRLFINFHCLYVDIKFVLLLYFRYHRMIWAVIILMPYFLFYLTRQVYFLLLFSKNPVILHILYILLHCGIFVTTLWKTVSRFKTHRHRLYNF